MSDLPKLVRDKIPEIIEEDGKKPEYYRVSDEEIGKWARRKILEEAKEFSEEGEVEELADLYAVIKRYMEIEDTGFEKLEDLEERKSEERGGFQENIILVEIK